MAKSVPCPNCKNGVKKLSTFSARADAAIACLNKGDICRAPLPSIIKTIKSFAGIISTAEDSLKNCEVCNNTRVITDTTDNSAQYKKVVNNLKKNVEKISELESKLGKGGDEFFVSTGDVVVQCGLIMNDTPSYRVDPQSSPTKGYVADGSALKKDKGTMWTGGGKTNAVVGLNPLPSPGGEYTLVCTNKYKLITGARGIEIKTGGPVTIDGGITRISGPQVTIGTSTGRLVLEGDVVNINGTSIELTPNGKGQVVVGGTLGVTGNAIVGGHAHMENVSFVGATCTGKNETTTTGSGTEIVTGPARWSGWNNAIFQPNLGSGLTMSLSDLLGHTTSTTSDVRKIAALFFPRIQNQILDKINNIAYNFKIAEHIPLSLPPIPTLGMPFDINKKSNPLPRTFELIESGYCAIYDCLHPQYKKFWRKVANGEELPSNFVKKIRPSPFWVGVVFSPPHVHALHDSEHSHVVKVPNINLKDDPNEIRSASSGAQSNATKSGSFESVVQNVIASISKSLPQVYAIYNKFNPFI